MQPFCNFYGKSKTPTSHYLCSNLKRQGLSFPKLVFPACVCFHCTATVGSFHRLLYVINPRKSCRSFTPFLVSRIEDSETPLGFLPLVVLQNFPIELSPPEAKDVLCIPHNSTLDGNSDRRSRTVGSVVLREWPLSLHSLLKICIESSFNTANQTTG